MKSLDNIAQNLINDARNELDSRANKGDQMHRRAVVGKIIYACTYGWDQYANGGEGQAKTVIRVGDQYNVVAEVGVCSTAIAEKLSEMVNKLLSDNGNIGIIV